MFFKSLAVVATLAFGAISSVVAAPLTAESNNILARCGCDGAAGIVTDVTASVAVYTQKLSEDGASHWLHFSDGFVGALTAAECTIDVLTPIVADIKGVIAEATVKVNALVGQEKAIVMATVDGTAEITVAALAQLVAALVIVSTLLSPIVRLLLSSVRRISSVLSASSSSSRASSPST